jgi:hypothetical protein
MKVDEAATSKARERQFEGIEILNAYFNYTTGMYPTQRQRDKPRTHSKRLRARRR